MKTMSEYQADWRSRNRERYNETCSKYYAGHKEQILLAVKERRRKSHISGVLGKVAKRARPDNVCEVCGRKVVRLNYHHWDDTNPKLGVWVCSLCHLLVGSFEKGDIDMRIKRYQDLKVTIITLDKVGAFGILVDNCLP